MRLATLAFMMMIAALAQQVDERCPGTATERSPQLLTSLEPLKEIAAKESGERQFAFRLTVTDTGAVRDPVIEHPAHLASSDKLKAEILKLRFCPAVRFSRYAETRMNFDIQLRPRL